MSTVQSLTKELVGVEPGGSNALPQTRIVNNMLFTTLGLKQSNFAQTLYLCCIYGNMATKVVVSVKRLLFQQIFSARRYGMHSY